MVFTGQPIQDAYSLCLSQHGSRCHLNRHCCPVAHHAYRPKGSHVRLAATAAHAPGRPPLLAPCRSAASWASLAGPSAAARPKQPMQTMRCLCLDWEPQRLGQHHSRCLQPLAATLQPVSAQRVQTSENRSSSSSSSRLGRRHWGRRMAWLPMCTRLPYCCRSKDCKGPRRLLLTGYTLCWQEPLPQIPR